MNQSLTRKNSSFKKGFKKSKLLLGKTGSTFVRHENGWSSRLSASLREFTHLKTHVLLQVYTRENPKNKMLVIVCFNINIGTSSATISQMYGVYTLEC